ncbi:carbonic anhydrase [Plantibacter sp. YIM 135347]|uniref:carbonic anhydrase n=1 Tax=Plantibacter sp. YIM 135347 TaxID=3423919 RepID=UPI003D345FA6
MSLMKRRSSLPSVLLLGGLALLLVGCTPAGQQAPSPSAPAPHPPALDGGEAHWAYSGDAGPSAWGQLSAEYAVCGFGMEQSPIDIPADAMRRPDPLSISYSAVDEQVQNNEHSLQVTSPEHNTVTRGGVEYALEQMHFHAPAEHLVGGERADVEFHFVHEDAEGNRLVIAVMGVVGASNASWDGFIDAASTPEGDSILERVDWSALLPDDTAHFSYDGSLTTPPCTEGVRWVVFTTPVVLGPGQIDRLSSAYHDNNRPVQGLDGRTVTRSE